jgi:hypothetical protein
MAGRSLEHDVRKVADFSDKIMLKINDFGALSDAT